MPLAALPDAPTLDALEPMDPGRIVEPFDEAGWSFELLKGGHRALLALGGRRAARLHSRGHVDITGWFREIVAGLDHLPVDPVVVDGEICVLDGSGRNCPDRLHARSVKRHPGLEGDRAVFCVRDVLAHEGRDVRSLPWVVRRKIAQDLRVFEGTALRPLGGMDAEGRFMARQAGALGAFGVLGRRHDSPYVGGRSAAVVLLQVDAQGARA
jgi:bifunctional non-homologous end joining protein LigD